MVINGPLIANKNIRWVISYPSLGENKKRPTGRFFVSDGSIEMIVVGDPAEYFITNEIVFLWDAHQVVRV